MSDQLLPPATMTPLRDYMLGIEEWCRAVAGQQVGGAELEAHQSGYATRRVVIDGQACMVTRDYRPDRINFHVRDGVVESAHVG